MRSTQPIPGRFTTPLIVLLLVAAVALVFSAVPGFDFLLWDDNNQVYANPHIRDITPATLTWMFTDTGHALRYTPLSWLNWAVLYRFFGLNPIPYHLQAVVLHAANAVLVFFLARVLFRTGANSANASDGRAVSVCAGLAALWWAVHPLRVEVVAWVTQERYAQAVFFSLISLLCYVRAATEPRHPLWRDPFGWLALITSVLSVLTYAVTAPVLVAYVLLDVYPLGRSGSVRGGEGTQGRFAWGVLLEKTPFVVAPGFVAGMTVWGRWRAVGVWRPPVGLSEWGVLPRLMQAFYMWARYLWRPWYPFHLQPAYTRLMSFRPFEPVFLVSLALVLAVSFGAWRWRRKAPCLITAWLAYLLLLVPVLGLMEHPHYPSDRYSYLPGIVYAMTGGCLLLYMWQRASRRLAALVSALAAVLTVHCGILAYRQTWVWEDSVSLFSHMLTELDTHPSRAGIHWRLGHYLMLRGNPAEAIRQFDLTLAIWPRHVSSLRMKGIAQVETGDLQGAAHALRRAKALRPDPAADNLLRDVEKLLAAAGSPDASPGIEEREASGTPEAGVARDPGDQ